MYLCTVPSTGTRYFRRQLPCEGLAHCTESSINCAKQFKEVATTYRDPFRVAASWVNYGYNFKYWNDLWYWWGELIKLPHVKIFDVRLTQQHGHEFDGMPRGVHVDTFKVHDALDRGDFDYFYKYVPENLAWPSV